MDFKEKATEKFALCSEFPQKGCVCFASGYLRPLREFHATIIGSNGNFLLQRFQAVRGSRLGTGLRFHQLWPCLPLSNRHRTQCTGVRVRHKRLGFTCISLSPPRSPLFLPAFPQSASLIGAVTVKCITGELHPSAICNRHTLSKSKALRNHYEQEGSLRMRRGR